MKPSGLLGTPPAALDFGCVYLFQSFEYYANHRVVLFFVMDSRML